MTVSESNTILSANNTTTNSTRVGVKKAPCLPSLIIILSKADSFKTMKTGQDYKHPPCFTPH